jgi:effector-binding domain-containing protein
MATDPGNPSIVERDAQPYVAIRTSVTMDGLASVAHRIPDVFAWLGSRGIEPADPPFFKYDVIDMAGLLIVEVGVPVVGPVTGEGEIIAGTLPAGRYATVTHVGPPATLVDATGDLLEWAGQQGLAFDVYPSPDGEVWGCRLESYLTDPAVEPDTNKWETALYFRLADEA